MNVRDQNCCNLEIMSVHTPVEHTHVEHRHADHTHTHIDSAEATPTPGGLAKPLTVGALSAGALWFVATHNPTETSLLPACPFYATTGLWCPGCGLTRATHALMNGDLSRAMRLNIFIIPVWVALTTIYGLWLGRSLGLTNKRTGDFLSRHTRAVFVAIGVALTFGVIRNLPGFEFLIGG